MGKLAPEKLNHSGF